MCVNLFEKAFLNNYSSNKMPENIYEDSYNIDIHIVFHHYYAQPQPSMLASDG